MSKHLAVELLLIWCYPWGYDILPLIKIRLNNDWYHLLLLLLNNIVNHIVTIWIICLIYSVYAAGAALGLACAQLIYTLTVGRLLVPSGRHAPILIRVYDTNMMAWHGFRCRHICETWAHSWNTTPWTSSILLLSVISHSMRVAIDRIAPLRLVFFRCCLTTLCIDTSVSFCSRIWLLRAMTRWALHYERIIIDVDVLGSVNVKNSALAYSMIILVRSGTISCHHIWSNVSTPLLGRRRIISYAHMIHKFLNILDICHVTFFLIALGWLSRWINMKLVILYKGLWVVCSYEGLGHLLLSFLLSSWSSLLFAIEIVACHLLDVNSSFWIQFIGLGRWMDLFKRDLTVKRVSLIWQLRAFLSIREGTTIIIVSVRFSSFDLYEWVCCLFTSCLAYEFLTSGPGDCDLL